VIEGGCAREDPTATVLYAGFRDYFDCFDNAMTAGMSMSDGIQTGSSTTFNCQLPCAAGCRLGCSGCLKLLSQVAHSVDHLHCAMQRKA
jgi:hypothetical protein